MDYVIVYNVEGVPGLQVGITDRGHVDLIIATESVSMYEPAQLASVHLALEQARVDQARIHAELYPTNTCPGSNRKWWTGTGNPICPVCHRGPRGLGVTPPKFRQGRWTGRVPEHDREVSGS